MCVVCNIGVQTIHKSIGNFDLKDNQMQYRNDYSDIDFNPANQQLHVLQ